VKLYDRGVLGRLKRAARRAAREERIEIRRAGWVRFKRGLWFVPWCCFLYGLGVLVVASLINVKLDLDKLVGFAHTASLVVAVSLWARAECLAFSERAALPLCRTDFFNMVLRRWASRLVAAGFGGGLFAAWTFGILGDGRAAAVVLIGMATVGVVCTLALTWLAIPWMRWASLIVPAGLLVLSGIADLDGYSYELRANPADLLLADFHPCAWGHRVVAELRGGAPREATLGLAGAQIGLVALSLPLIGLARRRFSRDRLTPWVAAINAIEPKTRAEIMAARRPSSRQCEGKVRTLLTSDEWLLKKPWFWLEQRLLPRFCRAERFLLELGSWRFLTQFSVWGMAQFMVSFPLVAFLCPTKAAEISGAAVSIGATVVFVVTLVTGMMPARTSLAVSYPIDMSACLRLKARLLLPRLLGLLGVLVGTNLAVQLAAGRFDPVYDLIGMGFYALEVVLTARYVPMILPWCMRNVRGLAHYLAIVILGVAWWGGLAVFPLSLCSRAMPPGCLALAGPVFVLAPLVLGWINRRIIFGLADWSVSSARTRG
jgi:hypothetical protein